MICKKGGVSMILELRPLRWQSGMITISQPEKGDTNSAKIVQLINISGHM